MKKIHKITGFLLIALLSTVLSVGCSKQNKNDNTTDTGQNTDSNDLENNDNNNADSSDTDDTGKEGNIEEPDNPDDSGNTPDNPGTDDTNIVSLPIYTINSDSLEREAVTVMIPKDSVIDVKFVVDTVIKSLSEHSIDIGIDSVTQSGDTAIVSFMKEKSPSVNLGAGEEGTVLDCISMSILDNVKSCEKVIFRIGGEAYESGHYYFEKDEVYKSLNK